MESLPVLLVVCICIAYVTCHHGYHDDDHRQVDHRAGHHLDSPPPPDQQYFFGNVHRPPPFGHPYGQSGHDMGHQFHHGHGMHGHGHMGQGFGSHGFRGEHRGKGKGCSKNRHHKRSHRTESTESTESTDSTDSHEEQLEDRTWRFQIGDNFGGFEYTDNNGHAKGFHIDLMQAVCKRAGKTCYFVVDAYHNCWNTQGGREYPGIGLMAHYYDGCIGNLPTPDRLNSLNFTLPFAPNVGCGLLYKPGTQRTSQEAHNVTGKRIGFVDGWALSKRCFQRQEGYVGNSPGQYYPQLYETHKGMMRALIHDEIDAALTVDSFNSDSTKLTLVEPTFSCTLGGSSVMTMYGSGVLDWWNDAFQHMKDDGTFRQLCRRATEEHGHKGPITCLHN